MALVREAWGSVRIHGAAGAFGACAGGEDGGAGQPGFHDRGGQARGERGHGAAAGGGLRDRAKRGAEFWMNLQKRWEPEVARGEERPEIAPVERFQP